MQPAGARVRRVIAKGQEVVGESAESIARQVDAVAERMVAVLGERERAEGEWGVREIEVSFGVQLTGEAAVAMFSGSVETSAQVTLRFTK